MRIVVLCEAVGITIKLHKFRDFSFVAKNYHIIIYCETFTLLSRSSLRFHSISFVQIVWRFWLCASGMWKRSLLSASVSVYHIDYWLCDKMVSTLIKISRTISLSAIDKTNAWGRLWLVGYDSERCAFTEITFTLFTGSVHINSKHEQFYG